MAISKSATFDCYGYGSSGYDKYTFKIEANETSNISGSKRQIYVKQSVYAVSPAGYQSFTSPKARIYVDGNSVVEDTVKNIWPRKEWITLNTQYLYVEGGRSHTITSWYNTNTSGYDYLPESGSLTVSVTLPVTATAATPTSVTISPNFIKDGKFNVALNDPVGTRYYKMGLVARNTDDTILSRDNAIIVYKTPQNYSITSDTEFLDNKNYYIENSGSYLLLVKDTDYHVGDDIETYFTDVYEMADYQYTLPSSALDKIYQLLRARNNVLDVSWVLYTYSDANYTTLIGDNKLAVNNLCSIPNPYTLSWVTHTIEDANSLDEYGGHPLNYYIPSGSLAKILSKAKFTFEAESSEGTCFGKTLSYAINNVAVESPHTASSNYNGETYVLATTMADPYASDITYTYNPTVINYIKPVITNLEVKRLSAVSDTIKVSYTVNYFDGTGMISEHLSDCTYDFEYSEDNINWTRATNLSGSGTNGSATFTEVPITNLNYKNPFYFRITVTDRIGWVISPSSYLPKGEPVWNAYSKSDGTNVMKINGELDFDAIAATSMDIIKSAILDVVYPVGSIYISVTEDTAAKVETKFGGTWEQIQDVFLLSAGQTYSAGTTGGEATHKLTVNEMPSHNGHLDAHAGSSGGKGNANKRYLDSIHSGGSTSYGWDYKNNEYYPYNISRGGNQAHNNMPPYLVVYMYKRTA